MYRGNAAENEIEPVHFGLGPVRSVHKTNCSAEEDSRLPTGGIVEARKTRFISTPGYMLSSLTG
jgi:hypothetical protein